MRKAHEVRGIIRRRIAQLSILPFAACIAAVLAAALPLRAQTTEQRGAFETTSLLGRKLYAQPDDAAIIAARKKRAADPHNVSLVIALSQAEANRRQYREAVATCNRGLKFAPHSADLYIEKGHRELGLREFRAAQRDLAHAAARNPKKIDAFYHLALSHYFQGQFAAAAADFRKARALAKSTDSFIDCSNWLYVSLRRAGEPAAAAKVLKRVTPQMKNTDPHIGFYLHLFRFYQGAMSEKAVLPSKPSNPNDTEAELAFDTVAYGVANWHLYNDHDPKRAAALFRQVVTGNAWNAWGFIGSEVELARLRGR